MKKPFPIYPPLVAAFPVLAVYSANLSMISWNLVVRPLLVAVVLACVVWTLFSACFRSWEKGAMATLVATAFFFAFSRLVGYSPLGRTSIWTLALWGLLMLVCAVIAGEKLRLTKPLNVLSSLILLSSAGQIAFGYAHAKSTAPERKAESVAAAKPVNGPDVFYIILDGYGRSDALQRAMGYDNRWFIAELQKRGFYVADKARSNYCQTELSIPSSMNMDYVQTLLPKIDAKEQTRFALHDLLRGSSVADHFRQRGYQYVTVTSGFPIPLRKSDLWLETRSSTNLLETQLLQMTPFLKIGKMQDGSWDDRRKVVLGAFDTLNSFAARGPRPRFIVAHIIMPHPPFVFGPNGEKLHSDLPVGFQDGSDYMSGNSPASYIKGYSGQVEYLNKLVLKTVDRLLSSPSKPILIIQGDHGSKLRFNSMGLQGTDLLEVFPNLNAFYVPEKVRTRLRPDITPVNSFRIVLSGLFGDDLPELPERNYYSSYQYPFLFTDVTARVTPK